MKKLIAMTLAVLMMLSLAACAPAATQNGDQTGTTGDNAPFTGVEDGVLTVGMECAEIYVDKMAKAIVQNRQKCTVDLWPFS